MTTFRLLDRWLRRQQVALADPALAARASHENSGPLAIGSAHWLFIGGRQIADGHDFARIAQAKRSSHPDTARDEKHAREGPASVRLWHALRRLRLSLDEKVSHRFGPAQRTAS